jgi:hypothetical protein
MLGRLRSAPGTEREWQGDIVGLFGRSKKDLAASGLRGRALVAHAERLDLGTEDDSLRLTDVGLGSYRFRFDLEVTLEDGRPPYTVSGKFKVPAKVGGQGGRGVILPVFADPDRPERVEVDWDQFVAEGGVEAFWKAHEEQREAKVREAVAVADADAARQLDAEVAEGKMTQAEADEQKRITALASAGELDDEPGINASPRETLDWQLAKGFLDKATYDAILANNPDLK